MSLSCIDDTGDGYINLQIDRGVEANGCYQSLTLTMERSCFSERVELAITLVFIFLPVNSGIGISS
jgi:hypothetical protein